MHGDVFGVGFGDGMHSLDQPGDSQIGCSRCMWGVL